MSWTISESYSVFLGLCHICIQEVHMLLHFKGRASHLLMNDYRCEQKGQVKGVSRVLAEQLEGWSWH